MDLHYMRNFWKVFGLFLLFSIIGGWFKFYSLGLELGLDPQSAKVSAWILILISYFFYFWSHYLLAKAKGYSGWLTLLAFINVIGIVILFLLPNKIKHD